MKIEGVTMGQIQWLCFWMAFVDSKFILVWLIAFLFFDDKELN